MKNIYDNGYKVLGTVKDLVQYFIDNGEETNELEDLIEELTIEYDPSDIVIINYDYGMGPVVEECFKGGDKVLWK